MIKITDKKRLEIEIEFIENTIRDFDTTEDDIPLNSLNRELEMLKKILSSMK